MERSFGGVRLKVAQFPGLPNPQPPPRNALQRDLEGCFSSRVLLRIGKTVPPRAASAVPPAPPSCVESVDTDTIDCPTWQSSIDSSVVWGSKTGSINAGTDPSCPDTGAIPCLLLQAIGTQTGPNGFGILTKVTYVQRLNTTGGSAPTVSCNAGDQALVPYTADYYFWKADSN